MIQFQPQLLLLLVIAIDYVVGTIAHTMREGFQSSKMREGLAHKFAYLVVLVVCYIIQLMLDYYELPFIYGSACFVLAFVWIFVAEVGSILENVVLLNPDLGNNSFMRIFDKRAEEDFDKQPTEPLPVLLSQDEEENCKQ